MQIIVINLVELESKRKIESKKIGPEYWWCKWEHHNDCEYLREKQLYKTGKCEKLKMRSHQRNLLIIQHWPSPMVNTLKSGWFTLDTEKFSWWQELQRVLSLSLIQTSFFLQLQVSRSWLTSKATFGPETPQLSFPRAASEIVYYCGMFHEICNST